MGTRLALAIGLALAAAPAFASTLEVGPPGSGYPYTSIQSAIDAASPGDVVLVHAGTYAEFSVSKHLRVIGDGPSVVLVQNTTSANPYLCLRVSGLPAGGEALVSGIAFLGKGITSGGSTAAPPVVLLEQSSGTILLHDVTVLREGTTYDQAAPNVELRDCAWVHLMQSSVNAHADSLGALRGDGIVSSNSTLWIARSVIGPRYASYFTGGGWDGLRLYDSVAYVAETWIHADTGGTKPGPACMWYGSMVWNHYGETGGDAIDARGATVVKLVGGPTSLLRGGNGGFAVCQVGSTGPAIRAADSSQVLVSDTVRLEGGVVFSSSAAHYPVSAIYPTMHLVPPAIAAGSQTSLELSGNAGHPALVFLSPATAGPLLISGIDGAVALDPSSASFLAAAALDPAGLASLAIGVPPSPVLIGAVAALQALEIGPTQIALSNPALLVVHG